MKYPGYCFDDCHGEIHASNTLTELIIGFETAELERRIRIIEYANG